MENSRIMSNLGHRVAPALAPRQVIGRVFTSWNVVLLLATCILPLLAGCGKKESSQQNSAVSSRQNTATQPSTQATSAPSTAQDLPDTSKVVLPSPYGLHTDDLDAMLKRRNIRALVIINPVAFFYSNGHPMGAMYEALRELEKYVNTKYKTGNFQVKVTFVPLRPDQVEAALHRGVGDFIAYGLVITPDREQRVAFTVPIQTNVKQVIVSRKDFGAVSTIEDLGGKEIFVNPLGASYQRLQELNEKLKKDGKPLINIKMADRNLLDDDLIEMVSAGMIPATVTSETRAKLWSQVLPEIIVHAEPVIASGEQTAWALRKDNPQLKQLLDEFIPPRAVGTSFGNTLVRRYLQNTKWVKNSTSPEEMKKFEVLSAMFKQYSGQYGFDYLMMMAQGYQESLLNQNARNRSGAVGIMQVIPKNAAANPINVKNVQAAQGNIEAGVKMLRNIEDQYFNDPNIDQLNKTLMVFASYNAGPNRIARLRAQAQQQGLDPNQWFGNVELMVAKDIGQETVTYVGNVYKYYIAYRLALQDETAAAAASK
jgi:membrane-bound lytic murein transglycosylase MltF